MNDYSRSKDMSELSTYIIPLDEISHHKHLKLFRHNGIANHSIRNSITLIKKEPKACVQSFSVFHQMIALKVGLSTFQTICVICFIETR